MFVLLVHLGLSDLSGCGQVVALHIDPVIDSFTITVVACSTSTSGFGKPSRVISLHGVKGHLLDR
jgi:hypothetical protein